MSDKRSVLTDAVATLGTLIDENQQRDAIHLATEPVTAGEKIYPGQDIGFRKGLAVATADKKVGIADPFLQVPIMPGERFWLIVYPRQITSLRHMWEHPDFPALTFAAPTKVVAEKPKSELTLALEYLESVAREGGVSYTCMMKNANYYEGETEIYTNEGTIYPDDTFWEKYNTVTGKDIDLDSTGYIDDGCRGC